MLARRYLRPLVRFDELVARLAEPYFRDARHVRLFTDEGPWGWRSHWGDWDAAPSFPPSTPELLPCLEPERIAACVLSDLL